MHIIQKAESALAITCEVELLRTNFVIVTRKSDMLQARLSTRLGTLPDGQSLGGEKTEIIIFYAVHVLMRSRSMSDTFKVKTTRAKTFFCSGIGKVGNPADLVFQRLFSSFISMQTVENGICFVSD